MDAAARALGMAAFTHDGVVHLPDRHGPVGTPAARALLAHELTHVAQHVRATLDPAHRPPTPPTPTPPTPPTPLAHPAHPAPPTPPDPAARNDLEAEAREVARRVARAEIAAGRPEPPPRADAGRALGETVTPPPDGPEPVPDDETLDRQARLLYPRVRALLDAELARDRQRAGRHPAGW